MGCPVYDGFLINVHLKMTKMNKTEALQGAIEQLVDNGCDPNIIDILQDLLEETEVVMNDTPSVLEQIEIYKDAGWIFVTTGRGVERLKTHTLFVKKEHPKAFIVHIRDNVTTHDLDDECEWAVFYKNLEVYKPTIVKRYNLK